MAETTYAAVAEATSPAAAPPTPSATSMQVGPMNPESSLPLRTRPTWLSATPENLSTWLTPSLGPTNSDPLTVPGRVSRPVAASAVTRHNGRMEWLLLGISVALVLACGVFGAAEYSFVAVDRAAVEKAAAEGDRQAQGVRTALRSLSTQLSGAQIGVTLTNLVIGFLAEPAIASLLEAPLTALGVPEGAVPGISVTLGLVLATIATMIFGELVPKKLGIAVPFPIARRTQALHARLHHGDDLADQAAQRLGQRASCGRSAWSRRRSSARPAPPTSWRRWPAARRARAPWTPRPPTWCSARSPSAPAPPARS